MTPTNQFAGRSLMAGAVLLVVTMVLHPAGGNLEHIVTKATFIIISHALAILSLPVLTLGFFGLSNRLATRNGLSLLGFFIILFGLVAVMFAAVVNGLALPLYAIRHFDDSDADLATVRLIVKYGSVINRSLDYVYIVAIALAIAIWSGVILRTTLLPRWLGYWGLLLILLIATGALVNFDFIGLAGFRLFVFSLVGWIVSAGYCLNRVAEPASISHLPTT